MRGLKDLIPKAMEGQKENTDTRLKELNTELKSLKTLMSQRLNPAASASPSSFGRATPSPAPAPAPSTSTSNANSTSTPEASGPKPASVTDGSGAESVASVQNRTASPFGSGVPAGRAAIPAWQLAAKNKSSGADNATSSGSGTQEASGSA